MIAQFAGCRLRRGRRGAARARRRRGDGRDASCGSSRGRWAAATRCRWSSEIWKVLEAFASFGFCKAHAAAFALPTYQSAWLKAHYPAHFLSGVLTHDPGMYPKRLILDDARQLGIAVLGLDVNASETDVRRGAGRRRYDEPPPERIAGQGRPRRAAPEPGLPRRPRLRHPAGAGGGQGHQRGRGGPDRGGPALPLAHRLLAPRPGLPAGGRAAGAGRRLRQRLRHRRRRRRRRAPPRQGHPARPAAPGGRPRPARAGRRPGSKAAAGLPPGRAGGRRWPRPARRTPAAAAPTTWSATQRATRTSGSATAVRRAAVGPSACTPGAGGVWEQAAGSRRRPGGRPGHLRAARPRPRRRARSTARSAGCRR